MKKYGRSGWFNDSYRHYLAAKGISTKKYCASNKIGNYLWAQDKEDTALLRKEMGDLMRERRYSGDTPEWREKWSTFMREKVWDDERRALVSETVTAMWQDDEFKKAMSDMHRANWSDPAFKEFVSKRDREAWAADDGSRRKLAGERRKVWNEENLSALSTERWKDPDYRKKVSKGISDAFDDGRKKEYSERMTEWNEAHEEENSKRLKEQRKDPEFSENMEVAAKVGRMQRSEKMDSIREAIRESEGDTVAEKFSARTVKI